MSITSDAGMEVSREEAHFIVQRVLSGALKPYGDDEAPPLTCIMCLFCGSPVILELVGGQYQATWRGKCTRCGHPWTLDGEVDEEGY